MASDGLRERLLRAASWDALGLELSVSVDYAVSEVAEWLRELADEIDRGPTFPLPPSVISALVRERADALARSLEQGDSNGP